MFFRFASAIVLVVLIALVGVALEKQNLAYERAISRQHYQMGVLVQQYARLRLTTEQQGAPERSIRSIETGELQLRGPERTPDRSERPVPLMWWKPAAATHERRFQNR